MKELMGISNSKSISGFTSMEIDRHFPPRKNPQLDTFPQPVNYHKLTLESIHNLTAKSFNSNQSSNFHKVMDETRVEDFLVFLDPMMQEYTATKFDTLPIDLFVDKNNQNSQNNLQKNTDFMQNVIINNKPIITKIDSNNASGISPVYLDHTKQPQKHLPFYKVVKQTPPFLATHLMEGQ